MTPKTFAQAVIGRPTEAEFQEAVVELAVTAGWRCYHTHDSRHSARGFPDLVLVRRGVLIFAELKRDEKSQPSTDQRGWLDALLEVEGVRTVLWRPSDWPDIIEALAARRTALTP